MTTSVPETTAHAALREATQALSVRRDGTTPADLTDTGYRSTPADLTDTGYRSLAADLADTLDAVASLVRSVGVGVPPNATIHGLLTAAKHVDMAVSMARHASGDHDLAPSTTHLEPERCGGTDG